MSLDLRLTHIGGGKFQARSRMDFDLCNANLEPDEMVRAKVTKARSVRENNFFHALCEAAFENQRGGPTVQTWQHLKSWLLVEVGHCTEFRVSAGRLHINDVIGLAGGIAKVLKQHVETLVTSVDPNTNEVVMRFAKSVKFSKTDADKMNAIVERAVAVICTQIVPGVDPATLLNMAKAKAA